MRSTACLRIRNAKVAFVIEMKQKRADAAVAAMNPWPDCDASTRFRDREFTADNILQTRSPGGILRHTVDTPPESCLYHTVHVAFKASGLYTTRIYEQLPPAKLHPPRVIMAKLCELLWYRVYTTHSVVKLLINIYVSSWRITNVKSRL